MVHWSKAHHNFHIFLSTDGSWCHFVAISMPTGITKLGCGEGRIFIQCKQHNYDKAARFPRVRPLSPGVAAWPLWLDSSAQLQSAVVQSAEVASSSVNTCRQGNPVFGGKKALPHQARGKLPYRKRSPFPWSSILTQVRIPNPHSLIGPERYCPNWSEWRCSDWSVKMLMGL